MILRIFRDYAAGASPKSLAKPELLHPRMADVYREKVGSLCLALEAEESRIGAVDAIRALIEAIVLEPDGDTLKITLKGDLAGMLNAARDSKRSPETGDLLVQIKLVAGARFAPAIAGGRYRVQLALSASHSDSITAAACFVSRGCRRTARSGMMPCTINRSRSARSAAP